MTDVIDLKLAPKIALPVPGAKGVTATLRIGLLHNDCRV
jgi:hypothetical protein